MTVSWIERAEAAMGGEPAEGIEVVPGHAPAIIDALGRSALLAPALAAFMWAAVVFRERLGQPLDSVTLLLRLLALALSVRAVLLGAQLMGRLRVYFQRGRYKLALSEEGLLLRTPRADFAMAKGDVVDVRERGAWQERSAARWAEVYLIVRPTSGRLYLTIPPLFERTPGVLAERLMRWGGGVSVPTAPVAREPAELASKLFDAVASGQAPEGTAVIEQGRGWLRRGPYATVLLGVALLMGLLRLPSNADARVLLMAKLVIGLCVLVVPGAWLLLTRREMAVRRGVALVLTPAELLTRTRGGVQRVRWSEVGRLEMRARRAWSILLGPHEARSFVIQRKDGDAIAFPEALLGAPAEVVLGLCEGYRRGVLP